MTIKISELENLTSITGEEIIPLALNNENFYIKIKNLIKTNVSKITAHISGKTKIRTFDYGAYDITNYDSFSTYDITAISGTIELSSSSKNRFYYYAPSAVGMSGFIINNIVYNVEIVTPNIELPRILTPINDSYIFGNSISIEASEFIITNNVDDYFLYSDWQLATDINFINITAQSLNNIYRTWSITNLIYNSIYYIRVRYKGRYSQLSDWSNISIFKTESAPIIQAPAILTPSNNSTGILPVGLSISSTAFNVINGIDTHKSTQWQLATDINFTNIISSSNVGNLISWQPAETSYNAVYYARVRYEGNIYGFSQWSYIVLFSTAVGAIIEAPIVSYPAQLSVNIPLSFTITVDNFSTSNGTDVHESTDWQIATDINFTNIVYQSIKNTTNKTSINIANLYSILASDNTYYLRVRFKGVTFLYSNWSNIIQFSTIDVIPNAPSILVPANNSIVNNIVTITSSTYTSVVSLNTHISTDWQLASDISFNNIVDQSINNTVNKTTWKIGVNVPLIKSTVYYLRVRYKGINERYSVWSNITTFTTMEKFININELGILTASDKVSNDYFGYTVSISGDGSRAIIGAQLASPSGISNAGKAYIFSRSETVWTQEAILTASDKAYYDYFGVSVSISGDGSRVIIGAYTADSSGISNAGKAYIFSRSGTIWTEEAILVASDKAANDYFGFAISISGDGNRAIVGAYGASPSGLSTAGKAYIYSRSGTVWSEEAILTASDKAANDYFGFAISISGDGSRVIIGAYQADPPGISNAGKAYIFSRSGTIWTEEAILVASDKAANDYFGFAISISGDGSRAIIGAYRADPPGISNAGKAYIYSRSGTVWTEEAILTASDKASYDYFGCAVSISGDSSRVIIGAYVADPSGLSNAGKAYTFVRSGTVWTQEAILTASDKASYDYFGYSVSISGDGIGTIIGSYQADPSGISDAGKAYIIG